MSHPQRRLDEREGHYKDAVLAELASKANVAQFASFGPGERPALRYLELRHQPTKSPSTVRQAIALVLGQSIAKSVNVRAFDPEQPKAHEFLYGLTNADDVETEVLRLAYAGLHTIVNETIDVADGGVSGVMYGGVIECAPDDTPRCVEKPGTAAFTREIGLRVLQTMYGFRPELDAPDNVRIEFSIHPLRRGVRGGHTILWEREASELVQLEASPGWPNRLSRFLGDKAFGLILADALGLPVPSTTVVSRRVAPFRFGRSPGTSEFWIRTCPTVPVPGHFTTQRGWVDPYLLMGSEDPEGNVIASVLAQEGVAAAYAGAAAVTAADGSTTIEGVHGEGDRFMLGEAPPEPLPVAVVSDVQRLVAQASEALGPVRLEWVHDGEAAWLVQVHAGALESRGNVLYPGTPTRETHFDVESGIEKLRELVAELEGTGEGVVLVGRVGVTSHFGDVLRQARIPSRIERGRRPNGV